MTIIILSGVLGFLLASLIALFLAPPLWRKAVKVTTRRLLQQSPRMMSDGQADRDQMRAEFAITTRKMEAKIEQLKETSDTQLIELSTTEKKRERLLEKIKSLQTTTEDREESIEKLNKKTRLLQDEIGKLNNSVSSTTDFSATQTKKLNAQATALEAQVYELDTYKQKRDRLQEKIKGLQITAGDREELVEKLNKKTGLLQDEIGKLSNSVSSTTDFSATQTKKLDAQATALETQTNVLEAQAYELDTYKQKRERLLEKIKSLQTTADDREESIEKLNKKTGLLQDEMGKLSNQVSTTIDSSEIQTKKLDAQAAALVAQVYELDQQKQKNSQLAKKLETRKKTAADLNQKIGMGREKITDLIGKINARDDRIAQLTREIATLKSVEASPSNETGRKDNDNKVSPGIASAKQPLAAIIINSGSNGSSAKEEEPATRSTPCAETAMGRPTHPKRRTEKKIKSIKAPKPLSLAERIRALQADHPKSV